MTAPRKGRSVEKENVTMEMVSSTPGWGLVSTGRGRLRTKGLPSCPRPVGALIDPDSSGSPGGQEGLRSLRAYLPSQTCVLAPQPPPCPPHTHCRRSCRPSFHTSGLFSRVTDSTGPLETGGWREGRWAVLVRAPPCTHHLLHHPWSPFLRESEASLCPCAPPL